MQSKFLGMKITSLFCLAGLLAALTVSANAESSAYSEVWGPSVGSEAPMLQSDDHNGTAQGFANLKGPNGLLFVFNRSVDW
jgi:hypothetical protein